MNTTKKLTLGLLGSRTVVDSPWFRAGDAPQPLAAYTAKGASDLTASLVNLVNPGTYDLTQTGASNVGHDTASGWGFSGDSALSMGSIELPDTFTIFIRIANVPKAGSFYMFGAETGGYKFGVERYVATEGDGRYYMRRGDASTITSAYQESGTHTFTSSAFYSNAVSMVTSVATYVQAYTIWIGGASGTTKWLTTGNVEYFAIYGSELTPAQIQALHVATQGGLLLGGAVLMFDDARDNVYSEAYSYMQPRGIVGTTYCVSSWVGTDGYETWAQLREMDAAGWSIGNHTALHGELSGESASGVQTAVDTCKIAMDAESLGRSAQHVAYPFGGTVSANMLTGMADAGMLSGRSTIPGTINLSSTGFYEIPTTSYPVAATTLTGVQNAIKTARRNDTWCTVLFHGITASPADYDWSTANYQALVDWLVENAVPCITVSDLYSRMLAARS